MILSKANQVGSGIEVIGILTHDTEFDCMRIRVKKEKGSTIYSIVTSTLKHSFNNGESWHTEDEIKEALEAKSKSCDDCEYYNEIKLAAFSKSEMMFTKFNLKPTPDFLCSEFILKHEPK